MRKYKPGDAVGKDEICVIFRTGMSRPVMHRQPDGTDAQMSDHALAGEAYVLPKQYPGLDTWLQRGNCYRFGEQCPTTPVIMDPPVYLITASGRDTGIRMRAPPAVVESSSCGN
jgi:hypothetical protein